MSDGACTSAFEVADELTVIVTTSPSPICPSTELIETILASLALHAPCVTACRLILVCDGAKIGAKQVFRSGHVNEASWTSYVEYKQRLHERVRSDGFGFHRAEVLELEEHHGFGFAVCAALQLVSSRLVCVVQHDRALLRHVALPELCRSMLALSDAVGYVLLPTRATTDYPQRMHKKLGERGMKPPASSIELHALALPSGGRLLPCLTFYDSTHICLAAYYRQKIFPRADKSSEARNLPCSLVVLSRLSRLVFSRLVFSRLASPCTTSHARVGVWTPTAARWRPRRQRATLTLPLTQQPPPLLGLGPH